MATKDEITKGCLILFSVVFAIIGIVLTSLIAADPNANVSQEATIVIGIVFTGIGVILSACASF